MTIQQRVFDMDEMVVHIYGYLLGTDIFDIWEDRNIMSRLICSSFHRCFVSYLNSVPLKLYDVFSPNPFYEAYFLDRICQILRWMRKNAVTSLNELKICYNHELATKTLVKFLECLDLSNIEKLELESWIDDCEFLFPILSRLSKVTHLRIVDCTSAVVMKIVTKFRNLEYLEIQFRHGRGFSNVIFKAIGEMPNLENLTIDIMYHELEGIRLHSKSLKTCHMLSSPFFILTSLDCPCLEYLMCNKNFRLFGVYVNDWVVKLGYSFQTVSEEFLQSIPYWIESWEYYDVETFAKFPAELMMNTNILRAGENCQIIAIGENDSN